MGIYPERIITERQRLPEGEESWVEIEKTPEVVRRRRVLATSWVEERTNCFCCSCDDDGHVDPACRNHGFAAQRPCEVHNMPGQTWDYGSPDDGDMPASVQEYRRGRA